jgi:uncharacterized membrane protein YtjA (UPF0391 family)
MDLIVKLIGGLFGGSGIASGIANGAKFVALAPIVLYVFENKDAIAVSLTYGQLALCGAFAFAMIQVAHVARGPGQ